MTLKLQVTDGAMAPEQELLTCAKSPSIATLAMFNVLVPEFVRVTDCVPLVAPMI